MCYEQGVKIQNWKLVNGAAHRISKIIFILGSYDLNPGSVFFAYLERNSVCSRLIINYPSKSWLCATLQDIIVYTIRFKVS